MVGLRGGSIGRLNQLIEIQRAIRTRDDSGELITTWETYQQARAEVIGTAGDEYLRGQQIEAGVTTLIRIRRPADPITPENRILVAVPYPRALNIARILDRDGRNVEYWLHCREVQ